MDMNPILIIEVAAGVILAILALKIISPSTKK
jgi:hypothetical protein